MKQTAHPLHDKEFLAMVGDKNTDRRTGRSTALAFRYISEAIANPGKPIRIFDHHGTNEADRMLAGMIGDIIHKTGLKHLRIKQFPLTLKFAGDEE